MHDDLIKRSHLPNADPTELAIGSLRPQKISPTDISQFIRLEQCKRYLRLHLRQRAEGLDFLTDYGVHPQAIPPLLTKSGSTFEQHVESVVRSKASASTSVVNFSTEVKSIGRRNNDNEHVIALARTLTPGSTIFLFQVRLVALVEGWLMRGDVDLLRIERDAAGDLHILIADMKSSTSVKVEHRLQVAFYHTMLSTLLRENDVPCQTMASAILLRGAAHSSGISLTPEQLTILQAQQAAAASLFGITDTLLEVVSPSDQDAYLQAVRDLVTDPSSTAHQVLNQPFDNIPFHLTYKCDGCLYNEFCMKWSAEHDDLSLIPHITALDKEALRRQGVSTVSDLASLKDYATSPTSPTADLHPSPTKQHLVRKIASSWPVGPRIDELVHRAKSYRRWKKDPSHPRALSYIPNKGHGSLPFTDPTHNPNLVRIYIDAQHDYLNDRIYLLSSLITACVNGKDDLDRRRTVLHITDGPPDTDDKEAQLFIDWVRDTVQAVVELAAPDENGEHKAPIHLIFYNSFDQKVLLDGLGRHLATVLGATPVYDFITQKAAFDSPLITYLDEEIRALKNYPMVSQSLYSVAGFLKFDWDSPKAFRHLFRERLFDFWGKFEAPIRANGETPWYTSRSRFNSQIPLEYAHAAWGELPDPPPPTSDAEDTFSPYRTTTLPLLLEFAQRRLEAIAHISKDLKGNHLTEKTPFNLPDLSTFTDTASTLADALQEFVTIERHVDLAAWKSARNMAPERRVLTGETLLLRYIEADQEPEVAALNQDAIHRAALYEKYAAAYMAANPSADKAVLTKEQKQETSWSLANVPFTFRVESAGTDADMAEILALTTIRQGDRVVLFPRYTYDTRLPLAQRTPNTPTPKQMLYGARGQIEALFIDRDPEGKATSATVTLTISQSGAAVKGYLYPSYVKEPMQDGALYTIDSDPNDIYGYWCSVVAEELQRLASIDDPSIRNALYDRITDPTTAQVAWSESEEQAQARFLAGLDALRDVGALHDFEESKRDYIGSHGADPVLLVQGPPGTGKSYSTAFAVFARLQGALAADRDFRIFVSCKTHAATDVLLENILSAQQHLQEWSEDHPDIFTRYFDHRLLAVPLYRIAPRREKDGITPLPKATERIKGDPYSADVIAAQRWSIVGGTPGGIYGLIKDRWTNKALSGHYLCHTLVLDEASQMDLPEACMAALPLHPHGQLIVVGDPRQMPPIVKHNWELERRRTFQQYKAYGSLFDTLLGLTSRPPMIKFSESFRLHSDMANFLKDQIYSKDGIDYHSNRHRLLPRHDLDDPFVYAVLSPEHPIVIVLHDEAQSQSRNLYEQSLVAPILNALADQGLYNLDLHDGLGVVVPHRAQRGDMQSLFPFLNQYDPITQVVRNSAVDTVERFQGGERTAIVISATESDLDYLLASSDFLYDPRRLTVAISRAKEKLVLVASRSVFSLFSPDEAAFSNAQLWKSLLRRTCTTLLWQGEQQGYNVQVWGKKSTS